jgi:ribonuclease R
MSNRLPTHADIVALLEEQKRPLHAGEIATHFGIAAKQRRKFDDLLDRAGASGKIERLGGHRFRAQRPKTTRPAQGGGRSRESWEGVLQVNPRGFGFVGAVGHDDVYIPVEAIGAALHGDTVRIEVVARSPRGLEGAIVGVVARRNPRIAGTVSKRRKSVWLEPDDTRVRGPIVITAGHETATDGAAAVARITRFPEDARENPEGEIVAVLGKPGEPKVEVAKILVREQVEELHSDAAMREAEATAARLSRLPVKTHRDLRQIPFLTIDPEDARDHDDAIWVERDGEGYKAYVAIADVSEYVQPGTALDAEARARSFTLYLPDRAVPMLPSALAADVCSLLPERDRLCLCAIMTLGKDGSVKSTEIVEGVIRAAAYLTYGGVARTLGFTETPPQSAAAEAFKRELKVFDEAARKLRKRRMDRGALDLNLPEPKLELDPTHGTPLWVSKRAHDPGVKRAYEIVEEFMLLANESVAEWLNKKRCPAIYRVHGTPDEVKLERLAAVCELLGMALDLDELRAPLGLSRWLAKIKQHPRSFVIEALLLRSLKQAAYDVTNIGHFGLASSAYLHFTSPIRRYPDLLVHRTVKHILRGGKIDDSASAIESLQGVATQASARERAVISVEREVVDLYRAIMMQSHLGETFEGTVSAVVGSGVFVALDDPFVDVLVRFEDLGPDRYEVDDNELMAIGQRSGDKIMMGDRLRLEILDVAILRRSVYGKRIVPEAVLRKERGRPLQMPKRKAPFGAEAKRRGDRPAFAAKGERKQGGPAAFAPTGQRRAVVDRRSKRAAARDDVSFFAEGLSVRRSRRTGTRAFGVASRSSIRLWRSPSSRARPP